MKKLLVLFTMLLFTATSFAKSPIVNDVQSHTMTPEQLKAQAEGLTFEVSTRGEDIGFEFTTDTWASEISWNLYDEAAGANYYVDDQTFPENNTTYNYTINLENGVYTVLVHDAYGDGGLAGIVTDSGSNELVSWASNAYSDEGAFPFEVGSALLEYSVAPVSISETLDPENTVDVTVTIDNFGAADLDFSVTNEMYDLVQFAYNVQVNSGDILSQAGVETDGNFIYTTVWNTDQILKFEMDGTYVGEFTIAGVSNLRDLAFDGTYFYGANASAVIWEMDFTSQTLVSTITGGSGTRAIAYDDGADAFWCNNWAADMELVDRTGATINTITGIESTYGAAYDDVNAGGPYLWVQTGTNGSDPLEIVQYDIAAGAVTGVRYGGYAEAGGNAGGLALHNGTFYALSQGEAVFGIDVAGANYWGEITDGTGAISAGATADFTVTLDAAGFNDITKTGNLTVNGTAGTQAVDIDIPVEMIVNGIVGSDLWPPSNFSATPNNQHANLAWDAPQNPDAIVLQYDDGGSENPMWVSDPPTGNDYFAVGFTYSADFSVDALRMLVKRQLETAQDIEYYVYGDNSGIPDHNNVLFSGMQNFEPGDENLAWVDFPITGVTFAANEVFYLISRWNPGNDYLVGMDTSAPDPFSFWTSDAGAVWNNLGGSHDIMFRAIISTTQDKAATYAKATPYISDNSGSIGSVIDLPKPDLARHNSKIGRKMIRSFTGKLDTRDLVGYTAYRDGAEVATVGADVEEYQDTPVAPGTYDYYVIANYTDGLSDPTPTIAVTTTEPPTYLFEDDFESLTGWVLAGEFEIDAPTGLGGEHGNPDPTSAVSGSNVLGVDLTGLGANPGDYEPSLGDREYTAESPVIDCSGFMNVTLQFQRYLNVETPTYDHAYIDVWDGTSWVEIYTNTAAEADAAYSLFVYDVPQAADNADFKVRFAIGTTDGSWFYSGWNIDDLVVNGAPIIIPSPTTLVAPADGATDVAFSGSLEWNAEPSSSEYLVYFDTNNPPTTLVTTTSDLSYDYADLDLGTEYFWRVEPTNSLGSAPGCPDWSFTTVSDQWQYISVDDASIEVSLDVWTTPGTPTATEYAHLTNSSGTLAGSYNATLVPTTTKSFNTPSVVDHANSETNPSQISPRAARKIGLTRDQFDQQFAYDVTTSSGVTSQAGVETDGEFIYTTVWNSGDFCKYDMDGNYIETFSVSGASNVRDLAYDGEYFYGADASPIIYKMDFTTQTTLETISYSGAGTRAIAYDEGADAFWVNNWDSDMLLIDRSGNTVNAISGIVSTYGAAYDSYTEGGPYLWIHTGTDGAAPLELIQYDIASGAMTGLSHSGYAAAGGNAGGMFISEGFVDGTVTIGVLSQGEAVFGFELAAATSLVSVVNPTGTVAASSTADIELLFDASTYVAPTKTTTETFTYDLVFTDDNGVAAPDVTEIIFNITYDLGIDEVIPTSTTLNQNYPNPFNPVTTIKFYNNLSGSVKLTVYNVKGELVNTLVNENINKGFKTVQFDAAGLNSGVYYYKLATPEKTITKKMILVK